MMIMIMMIIVVIIELLRVSKSIAIKFSLHDVLVFRLSSPHKPSFIPRACNLWNVLPSSCFPESFNLRSFKSKIN